MHHLKQTVVSSVYPHKTEMLFESLRDWSLFYSMDEVKQWFLDKRKNCKMRVIDIPLKEVAHWVIDNTTGNIFHDTKDFFIIHGIQVNTDNREVGKGGWEQPILEQVGYDGGILGLIRKRFRGVPHYLCEAKSEPGNYGKVQLSPTLQATFANLRQSHKGKKPNYARFFENNKDSKIKVLFDSWLAEDGGRLYLKRNRGILIEIDENIDISLESDDFIWLSLHQIKELLIEDAWINPHLRGILAHV